MRTARENDPLMREAAEWALELDSPNVSIERMTEWQRWLARDPSHARHFEHVEELLSRAGRMRAVPWPTRAQLAADRYDGKTPVSAHLSVAAASGRKKRGTVWMLAAAAGAILFVVTLLLSGRQQSVKLPGILSFDRVATPVGGTQKILLADGSAIDLSAKSTLRATLTRGARRITLESGEAFFRVAKDATRPFTVHAGDTAIKAVGTAFNVRRTGNRIVVAVSEGAVLISTPGQMDVVQTAQLTAGQQAIAEHAGSGLQRMAIDARSVAGWREGRLRYLDEPLASVTADVGRYTARDIEITDPALQELRITGTVLENNLEGWLTSLEEAFPLTVTRHADGSIRISARPAPPER